MSERRNAWESRYLAGRTGWDRGGPSPALVHWLSHVHAPSGRVLVPGCGHGHEVADLVRAGLAVTAVDIAAQPVLRLTGDLIEQGLHAQVVQADLLHWQPPEPFDAVYEQTSLCAFDPVHWEEYARRLADWTRPGGVMFGLFMQTGRPGGPPYDCPIDVMRNLFDARRWVWLDEPPLVVDHPNGLHEEGFVLLRR
jgi:SAM-dependent methyltransferase